MKSPKTSALDSHLGYWLRFVSNAVSLAFAEKVEARGVTVAEWAVMRVVFDGDGLNPSVVADRLGMTRGGISKIADRLAAKGLAARRADPVDGRFQALALTPAGRRLVPDLAALADRNDDEFFGHLKPAERRALEAVMRDIVGRRNLHTIPTS